MSTILSLADAVVDLINGATLSQPVTAERKYVPVQDLPALTILKVTVVPASLTTTLLSRRGQTDYAYAIDIGIQRSIGSGPLTEAEIHAATDPLMTLTEEIALLFQGLSLVAIPGAVCTEVLNRLIYNPAHLDEQRVFTSVITLTFSLVRP